MITDFCDKLFCINLESEKKRWAKACVEFEKIGIYPVKIPAIKHKRPHIGCRLSHQFVIEKAKDYGWKSVGIFEDDVIFKNEAIKTFDAAVKQLPDNWDLFYLGCYFGTCNKYTDNLLSITSCKLGHAVFFNSSVYDIILTSREKSMDRTNLLIHPREKSYCINPMIADQQDKPCRE